MYARTAACGAILTGAGLLVRALTSGAVDWPMAAFSALAAAMAPMTARVTAGSDRKTAVRPVHIVTFAGALALGPAAAALCASFAGLSSLVRLDLPRRRPILRILLVIFRPAAVAGLAAAAYSAAGGDVLWPHDPGSITPCALAALTYVLAERSIPPASPGLEQHAEPAMPARGWVLLLCAGYCLSVLCAIAPPYVLFVPLAAAGALNLDLRRKQPVHQSPEAECEPAEDTAADEEQASFVDPSTGLASRRYLDMFLEREIARAQRTGGALSLAVFNIDNASRLDAAQLDAVVAEMGSTLKAEIRGYDIAARYSEGRVVVLFPGAQLAPALDVAARLLGAVRSIRVRGASATVSAGLASLPEHGLSADELIDSAHYALNRGRFAPSDAVHTLPALAKAS